MTIPIIILNWHGLADTTASVQSALAQTHKDIEIHLIDNDSGADEQAELVRLFGKHPRIQLYFNARNEGFARAHNLMFAQLLPTGKYKYIALLNNDAFAEPQWLEKMVHRAETDQAGMVSCKMLIYGSKGLVNNLGHKMLNTAEIVPIAASEPADRYNEPFSNVGASGGACLYSTAMLNDIGTYDPYFVTGYEDAELGVRALLAGYPLRYEPDSVVDHKVSVSVDKVRSYDTTLKLQLDVLYTYFKLMPWPVIVCSAPFYIVRTLVLFLCFILFGRFTYFRIFFHGWYLFLTRDRGLVLSARRKSKSIRRLHWWQVLANQEFFLRDNLKRFHTYFIKGQKTVFERYKA